MCAHRVAATVENTDLGAYQQAARLILLHGVITEHYPGSKALALVQQFSDELAHDLRDLFGYTLQTSARHVRLLRRLDAFDDTQALLTVKTRRAFDRRRLAYLCLILACLHRSRIEITLADLVALLAPAANAIGHLGFDATVPGHKDAVVDAMDWLVDRGALHISDGSMEDWARDHDRGDALFDIDHDTCTALFRPNRPLQHLTSARGLLDTPAAGIGRDARRRLAAQRARRLLIEHPVLYFSDSDAEMAAALRQPSLAEDLTRLTGLPVERRAEGIMLVDTTGHFTDRRFPGRGGAVNRTAGLLLAKIADLREDPARAASLPLIADTDPAQDHADLLERIDLALPATGTLEVLADAPPHPSQRGSDDAPGGGEAAAEHGTEAARLPFVAASLLHQMITELYAEFGATSFTNKWQADPGGLLTEALALLADLRLIHRIPGGILVRPAAARYRNITAVLPRPAADGQLPLDFLPKDTPA
ncbi:DUF2398 family protein [Streptomyces sp. NPDC050085]|uniref:DUF2398 family protein n=1 Tax=Streptomyces sp. NPDC050085 TaxID=3365600 RepID=UPI0037B27B22